MKLRYVISSIQYLKDLFMTKPWKLPIAIVPYEDVLTIVN